ncbi:MAG: L-seryl-tRNA(Sec) selenium transferase [Armatimonadetes bacterium]|nr:L-seryl-tRNA(Sec) selenium transferase [Armatimonadota bacterium]
MLVALERRGALCELSRSVAAELVRGVLDEHRARVRAGDPVDVPAIERAVLDRIGAAGVRTLRPFLNASGILLHTNLGRAPLAEEARIAVQQASGASSVELNLETGRRGSRQDHLEPFLRDVTGGEAALVVNNNAAAVLLATSALAAGREVIVSRGEQVEIGGSFRMPDVVRASGAALVEVGTTNRTRLGDYEQALTPRTALLLKVHRSNFRVIGFTEETGVAPLAALGRQAGVPMFFDLGSGALLDVRRFGLENEPTVQQAIAAGADLVAFSGDKLLGGPQAGILVGKAALIAVLRRHPLARAMRLDKLGVAALAETLRLYRNPERAVQRIPIWRMLAAKPADLRARCDRLAAALRAAGPIAHVTITATQSEVGGGALPGLPLPSFGLRLRRDDLRPAAWAARLRSAATGVLVRLEDDALVADLRSLLPEDDEALRAALAS